MKPKPEVTPKRNCLQCQHGDTLEPGVVLCREVLEYLTWDEQVPFVMSRGTKLRITNPADCLCNNFEALEEPNDE